MARKDRWDADGVRGAPMASVPLDHFLSTPLQTDADANPTAPHRKGN